MAASQARPPAPPHPGGESAERPASSPRAAGHHLQLDLEEREGIPTAVWAVGVPPGGKVTDWRQEACAQRRGQCCTQKDLKLRSRAEVRPGLCPPRALRWHLRALGEPSPPGERGRAASRW